MNPTMPRWRQFSDCSEVLVVAGGVSPMDDLIWLARGERKTPAVIPVGVRIYAHSALC